MGLSRALYTVGVLCAAITGFCSPVWYLGFVPLSVGAIWAAYDLVDVKEPNDEPPIASTRGT